MSNEVYAFALNNALKEAKSVCPDLANTFIFDNDNFTLAKDPDSPQETIDKVIEEFRFVKERAEVLEGLERVTVIGCDGRVSITRLDNFYLATIVSKEADEKFVGALYRVLIPTVVKVVDQLQPPIIKQLPDTMLESELRQEPVEQTYPAETVEEMQEFGPETIETERVEQEFVETEYAEAEYAEPEQQEIEETLSIEETESEEYSEPREESQDIDPGDFDENGPVLPEPPVTQVIVENLGGLLVKSDTVRIDYTVISHWNDLYGDRKIEEVDLEALDGKTTRCKFKPIKDSKYEGKGVIQMPEKIQIALETSKGELVMVKPVVE